MHPNRREESAFCLRERERERERENKTATKNNTAQNVFVATMIRFSRQSYKAMTTTTTMMISRTAFASSVRSDRSKTVVPMMSSQKQSSSRFYDDAPRVSSPRTLSRLPRRSPGRRRAGRRRARWTRSARRAMDAYRLILLLLLLYVLLY